MIDGVRIETDPELISVVLFESGPLPGKQLARRVHGEMCLKYQTERARIEAQAAAKRAVKASIAAKKAPSGKREPGQ